MNLRSSFFFTYFKILFFSFFFTFFVTEGIFPAESGVAESNEGLQFPLPSAAPFTESNKALSHFDKGEKAVRVGYYYDERFLTGLSDEDYKEGFGYEYLQKVSYFTRWHYDYVYGSFNELFEKLKSGKIDLLAGVMDKKERHGQILYSDYVMASEDGLNYYVCAAKSRQDLIQELNSALEEIYKENPFFTDDLYRKYLRIVKLNSPELFESDEFVSNLTKLKIGYFNNYLPFSLKDNSGNAIGAIVDIANAVFENLGLQNKIQLEYTAFDDYAELLRAVNDGIIDIAFPVINNSWFAEHNNLYLSKVLINSGMNLAYIDSYSEDLTKNIAVNRNNRIQFFYATRHWPEAEIVLCDSIDDCLMAVLEGTASSTLINALRSGTILKNRIYNDILFQPLLQSEEFCFAVKNGNTELLALLNRGINLLDKDFGFNVACNYTDSLYKYTFIDFLGDNITAVLVVAIILVWLVALFFVVRQHRLKVQTLKDKKVQIQLKMALKNANVANKAKTDFLNNVSHDIRTPMNAIIGFTTLAQDNLGDTQKLQSYLEKITKAGNHLLRLINDILDMSRIESGQVQIEESECKISEIVENIESIISTEAAKRGQTLKVQLKNLHNDEVYCDKTRLEQILLNILYNSVKYTQNTGTIEFVVQETSAQTASLEAPASPDAATPEENTTFNFTIKDNGIGMSASFLDHIFEPFAREKNTTKSRIAGTGLGMSITKYLCDLMGAQIDIQSEKNAGTKVSVTIKMRKAKKAVPLQKTDKTEVAEFTAASFAGVKILLAEDNELNAEIATAMLSRTGADVIVAEDGLKALKTFEESPQNYFDLIFMDIQMPQLDGYETTQKIRGLSRPDAKTIPIIAMTANAFEDDKQNALSSGMNSYLAKPIRINLLYEVMAKFLPSHSV